MFNRKRGWQGSGCQGAQAGDAALPCSNLKPWALQGPSCAQARGPFRSGCWPKVCLSNEPWGFSAHCQGNHYCRRLLHRSCHENRIRPAGPNAAKLRDSQKLSANAKPDKEKDSSEGLDNRVAIVASTHSHGAGTPVAHHCWSCGGSPQLCAEETCSILRLHSSGQTDVGGRGEIYQPGLSLRWLRS